MLCKCVICQSVGEKEDYYRCAIKLKGITLRNDEKIFAKFPDEEISCYICHDCWDNKKYAKVGQVLHL